MGQRTLLPDSAELVLGSLQCHDKTVVMVVHSGRSEAACPRCLKMSRRIHSHYERKLADLPWNGLPVQVRLCTRRFFCETPKCGQRIFTERLPRTVTPHARRTQRLANLLNRFTLALGGEAGARLAHEVGVVTSGDTLLRQLRKSPFPILPTPRVLGVDDWAWRKGQRYGTILCDPLRGRVVDLLEDRKSESVTTWLQAHPGIEVITRDRAGAYAEAARAGAPHAVQVADRWHLLRNLSDALQRTLEPRHAELRKAAQATEATAIQEQPTVAAPMPKDEAAVRPPPPDSLRQARRSRRLARYEAVMELVQQGVSQVAIERKLGIGRRTVRRWLRAGGFPERQPTKRHSSITPFASYLEQRFQQGCRNAAQLWRELREQGFAGSQVRVRGWVQRLRPQDSEVQTAPAPTPHPKILATPRQTAWMVLKQPPEALAYLEEVARRCPEITATGAVAREFVRMVREHDSSAWTAWLQAANATKLARFANDLRRDEAAVLAALRVSWSNGSTEGQVHRLKLIKRQMYGRAKFDLLRLRVLHAA